MAASQNQTEQNLSANDTQIDLNNLGIYEYFKAQMMGDNFLQAIKAAIASAHKDSKNREILAYITSELKKIGDTKKVEKLILEILTKRFKELQTKDPSNEATNLLSYIITDLGNSLGYNTRPSSIITPSPLEVLQKTANEYKPSQKWTNEISNLLKKKNLKKDLFASSEIKWSDDIAAHVKWAFNKIYSVPYPNSHEEWHKLSRYFHGIQHVTRAALHVPVFVNLYRKHGDADALKLTDDDVKLLQLAALFHDSAREGEAVDYWDHESGMFLYTYLTQTLHTDKNKAKLMSEAIANKDISKDGYFEINEDKKGELTWEWNKTKKDFSKNIYQKIVHDADCLEVIRARDVYNASYLDFYSSIASTNKEALEEMAYLVTEARSLIDIQGDTQSRTKPLIKQKYEHQNAYHAIKNDISQQRHPIMSALNHLLSPKELKEQQLVDTSTFDEAKGLTDDNLRAALREGKIYARGISIVSARNQKHANESLAALELRKTMREKGVPTETKKEDRYQKEGNPYRSVSMIGYGSGVFTNAGFLILNPNITAISHVSAKDADTGFGKKSHLKGQKKPSTTEIQNQLTAVHDKMKLGGEARNFAQGKAAYVEILYDVKNYQAIFYTNDATFSNTMHYGSAEPVNKHAPLLQAIYLQKQYEIDYEKSKKAYVEHLGEAKGTAAHEKRFGLNKTLPIILYSGTHNEIKQVNDKELTDENIVKMWTELCTDFINDEIKNPLSQYAFRLSKLTPKQIKILAMYRKFSADFVNAKDYGSADELYSPELQEKINQAINKIPITNVNIKTHAKFQDVNGETRLMRAVGNNNKDSVKDFIEAKDDLEIQDKNGNSALLWATYGGRKDIAEMLISAGANIEQPNNKKETALDIAIQKKDLSFVALLLEKNATIRDLKALKNYLDRFNQQDPDVIASLEALRKHEKSSASTPQLVSKNPATLLYEKKEQKAEMNKSPKFSEIINNAYDVIKTNYQEPLGQSAKTKGRKKWELHNALDKALQNLARTGTNDKTNINDAISAIKEIQTLFAKFVQEVDIANGEKDAEKGVPKEQIDKKFFGVKADTLKIRNDYMAKQGGKQILEKALNELTLIQQDDLSQTKKLNN